MLAGAARVVDVGGRDVSAYFVRGAELALARARGAGARVAVLKEGSPSCGTGVIHDGSFSSTRVPGLGVAAELLRQSGFWVFSEAQLAEAARLIERLEAGEAG